MGKTQEILGRILWKMTTMANLEPEKGVSTSKDREKNSSKKKEGLRKPKHDG